MRGQGMTDEQTEALILACASPMKRCVYVNLYIKGDISILEEYPAAL